ncbi:MAG: hypothetical protein JW774_03435 [Candidatus Aureabacteria bacterium]|nr:hypothetical protein [Candidatus Auribacterota bacterium]
MKSYAIIIFLFIFYIYNLCISSDSLAPQCHLDETVYEMLTQGTQYYIIRDKSGGLYKVQKTDEETVMELTKWSDDGYALVEANIAGKNAGFEYYQRLSGSGILTKTQYLGKKSFYVRDPFQGVILLENRITFWQPEIIPVKTFIRDKFQEGNVESIKNVLSSILRKYHQLWSLGFFDFAFNPTVNWGVVETPDGFDVQLFDFWEMGDLASERIQELALKWINKNRAFENRWDIMDSGFASDATIEGTTNRSIARWFIDLLNEEFTVDKFQQISQTGPEAIRAKAQVPASA